MVAATETRKRSANSKVYKADRKATPSITHFSPGSTPLPNPRWESFVRGITTGLTPTESLISCGYSETGASGAANRLLKNVKVATRLQHLSTEMTRSSVQRSVLTRDWVIENLKSVAVRCMETKDFRPQAATNALVALGKEIGMFRENINHNHTWDGNPASLTTAQLTTLILSLSSTAFEGDPEALEQWRRDSAGLLDAPGTIDVKSERVSETEDSSKV